MTSREGGFYSAFDAETDAVEGQYYVWSRGEISKLLSPGAQQIFFSTYGLEELPQFPDSPANAAFRLSWVLLPLRFFIVISSVGLRGQRTCASIVGPTMHQVCAYAGLASN
jgi:hypothetical protein